MASDWLRCILVILLNIAKVLDCEQSLFSQVSKLGRTGESELAERETGERREEEGLHSLL